MTQRIEQKITLPSVSAITNRNQPKLTEESKWYSDQYKTNVGTIIIILLLSLYLLWDTTRDSDIGNRKPIGKVASTINDIERKLGARVVWKSIERNNTIYNYDSIRTNSISRTTVELNDKTKVSLAEDTMVFINTNPEKLDINFIRGEISVDTMNRTKSEVEKINIVHGKEVIKLGKTNLNLSRPTMNSSVELELKDGDAKLEKDGVETPLKKGELVVSKGELTKTLPKQDTISKEKPLFLEPKKDKKLEKVVNKKRKKINNTRKTDLENLLVIIKFPVDKAVVNIDELGLLLLRWEKLQNAKDYQIRLTRLKDDFVIINKIVENDTYRVKDISNLTSGQYKFSVQASLNGVSVITKPSVSTFTIQSPPIKINFPKDKSKIDIGNMEHFTFSWDRKKYVDMYEIQLIRQKEQTVVLKKLVSANRFTIKDFSLLKQGKYKFSVGAKGRSEKTVHSFEIYFENIDTIQYKTPQKIFVE